uniref:Uncharacterized protein n=1 Tax=Glossina palpalis gambiensis TaxID=67801 RepID=A0A1B0AVY7_9MUSC
MMSASTASYTFNRVSCIPSLDTIQKYLLYHSTNNNSNHNDNNNSNIVTSATYYYLPQNINTDYALLSQPKTTSEETLLLEKALRTDHRNGRSGMGILMHKSIIKPKYTILNQGSINSHVNTSLTTNSVTEYSGIVLMPKTNRILIKNDSGRAILRVISGPRAFRVVLFTRLTSIPFGIQNAMFGISSTNPRVYHTATFLGLLPAQMINIYLGSTLRSIHEVLSNHGTAITGYISFGVEIFSDMNSANELLLKEEIETYRSIQLSDNCDATISIASGEIVNEGQVAYGNSAADVETENADLSISQVDNCKFTSTKNSEELEINCTKNESTKLQEYTVICNKFNIPKLLNKKVALGTLSSPPAKTGFSYHEGTMHQFNVFSNVENIIHPKSVYKIPQVRGMQRNITKIELKTQKAAKWRNINLAKQTKGTKLVGNFAVPSGQVIRKIRSEAKSENSRHTDSFIDLYLIRQDKNWSECIQKIYFSLEIYLYSLNQFKLVEQLKPHTLFIATGNIIKKIESNSKRIFMYSSYKAEKQ